MDWTSSYQLGANQVLICTRPHLCSSLCEVQLGPTVLLRPLYLCYKVSVLLFLFCTYMYATFSAKREIFVSPTHLNFAGQAVVRYSIQNTCNNIHQIYIYKICNSTHELNYNFHNYWGECERAPHQCTSVGLAHAHSNNYQISVQLTSVGLAQIHPN